MLLDWIGLTSDYGVSTVLKIVAGPLLSLLIPCLVEVNGPLRLALVADGFVPFLSKVFLAVKHFIHKTYFALKEKPFFLLKRF